METQNFFFVPQQDEKHLSLFFTKLTKTYNLSYSIYKTKGLLQG